MKKESAERFILSLLFSLLVLFISGPFQTAAAQLESPGLTAPKLGNFIDIRVDNLENNLPKVAYNTNHKEFLVVWEETIIPARREIFGQRVGLDGTLKGNAIRIAYDSTVDFWLPDVSYSSAQDKYLIVYTSKYSLTDYDIRSVLMNWDGSSLVNGIIDTDSSRKTWYPAVIYNSQNDEFLTVYENYKPDPQGREIMAQRVKAGDGSLVGTAIIVAGGANQVRRNAKVAYNNVRNEYLLGYSYAANTSTLSFTIRAKIISADLNSTVMNETELTTVDYADGASVAAGPNEYLVVWNEGTSLSAPQKIWGKRLTGTGTIGPFIKLADHDPDHCFDPSVSYSSFLGYVVTWSYKNVSLGNIFDVIGRTLKAGQDTPSNEEFPISHISYSGGGMFLLDGQQRSPALACGTWGICLAAYEDNCCILNPDYEIRGRLVTPNFIHLPLIERK
jgi:hypothetical protein